MSILEEYLQVSLFALISILLKILSKSICGHLMLRISLLQTMVLSKTSKRFQTISKGYIRLSGKFLRDV